MQHSCPQCGAPSAPEATTCPSCGFRLRRPAPTLEAAPPARVPTLQKNRPSRLIVVRLLGGLASLLVLGSLLVGSGFPVTHQVYVPPQPTSLLQAVLYADPLTTDRGAWQCAPLASCQYESHGLHILAPTDHLYFSTLSGHVFGDVVIDVQAQLDNGDPAFVGVAIAFRSTGLDGYGLLVYANGTYEVVKWDARGTATILIPPTASLAILTGLTHRNELKVLAKGADITLFSNGHMLNRITDPSFSSGQLALGAARFAADAVFSNLVVTSP